MQKINQTKQSSFYLLPMQKLFLLENYLSLLGKSKPSKKTKEANPAKLTRAAAELPNANGDQVQTC